MRLLELRAVSQAEVITERTLPADMMLHPHAHRTTSGGISFELKISGLFISVLVSCLLGSSRPYLLSSCCLTRGSSIHIAQVLSTSRFKYSVRFLEYEGLVSLLTDTQVPLPLLILSFLSISLKAPIIRWENV